MTEQVLAVFDFLQKIKSPTRSQPTVPPADERLEYIAKLQEELAELTEAMAEQDIYKIADGLGDMLYMILGGFIKCGISASRTFREVHESNMTKELGLFGQVLKGEGYRPPNMRYAVGD